MDYAKVTKKACIKTYGDGSKRSCHQYSSIGTLFGMEDPSDGG